MFLWQEKALAKRRAILSAIRPEWLLPIAVPPAEQQRNITGEYIRQFLSPNEITITESSPQEILANTTSGNWTAVSVATAFSHRAALAHQLTNCLHEIFFEQGIKHAEELDVYFKQHKKPIGPLHGLPISLKDSVNVKGIDTTTGFVSLIDQPAKEDAELVKILNSLGAVLYCKTAVPQASFAAETENHIIGYTTNAQNRLLSSGGSSGGEGPLIALRGSIVGFGTDIGGSIRHPAALNGLFGLKPSFRRLPFEGITRVMEGQDVVPFSLGPLSSSAAGLALVMKSILGQEPWLTDPRVVQLPWREEVYEDFVKAAKGGRRLTFGVMRNDGIVNPQPPVSRAVEMLVQKVKSLGHAVIQWKPPSHNEATKLSMATWKFDGSEDVHKYLSLSGEPIVDSVAAIFGSEPRKQYTATEIADTNIAIWRYRKRYMDYWNSTKELTDTGRPVDAVIAPTYPYAGVIPGKLKYAGYTPFANVLDYSVGVIPVTTADKTVDIKPSAEYKGLSRMDSVVQNDYDAEIQDGAPIGISIFARRFQDEQILGILQALGDQDASSFSDKNRL